MAEDWQKALEVAERAAVEAVIDTLAGPLQLEGVALRVERSPVYLAFQ